jgi:lysophospholipase L1-like esterase
MSMRTLIRLFSILAVAASVAGAAHSQNVRVLGRSEPSADSFAVQWPGSGFEVQMRGSRLTARIDDWGSNVLNVEADGEVTQIFLQEGVRDYVLFDGLIGTHTIKVSRRTGTPTGPTRFLDVSADGPMMPTDVPARRMLVIGDSVTSGYGVEGENQYCTYSYATHNHDLAYPALTAQAFNADLHSIAADGLGLIRNFAGEGPTMQDIAWRELPDSDTPWARLAYRPQVIVINLGSADFAAGDPGATFDAAYVTLLTELRQTYPQAAIYGAIGGLLHGEAYAAARDSVLGAVNSRRDAGDDAVHFIEFELKASPRRFGCDWHPGADAHRQMAEALQAAISRDLGWRASSAPEGLLATR